MPPRYSYVARANNKLQERKAKKCHIKMRKFDLDEKVKDFGATRITEVVKLMLSVGRAYKTATERITANS